MKRDFATHPVKRCPGCSTEWSFDRSYGFHAGFSNLGFLYDETGQHVLAWSSFDSDYVRLAGEKHPWTLDDADRARVEASLRPSPSGRRWGFAYPARCPGCRAPISGPMTATIMGLALGSSDENDADESSWVVPFGSYLA
jgi:hypothetical protein